MTPPWRDFPDAMKRHHVWTGAIVLLLLVSGAGILRQQAGNVAGTAEDSPLAQDFDYYLSDMALDRFGPDGTLLYHLTSARVTHYPTPERSLLEQPLLVWLEPGQPDWILTARNGNLHPDLESDTLRLLLQQDVVASRTAADGATLLIRSESLLVLPDAGEAMTETAVSMDKANTHLQAAGMQAWLRENRVRMSAGRGKHE